MVRARSTDPSTAHLAAASVRNISQVQAAILRTFRRHGPMCDDQLMTMLPMFPPQSESGVRTRRKELVRKGLLKDSGETTTLPSGRESIVWELT